MSAVCRVAVLASGKGSNLGALLQAQTPDSPYQIILVVSDKPDAGALEKAKAHNVNTAVIRLKDYPDRAAFDQAILETLKKNRVDFVVLAGFMKILGPELIAAYRNRILNIHPALLPEFPGAHAVRDALATGVKKTGCTVHLVDEGVDTGPVLLQAEVPIFPDDTEETLHQRIHTQEYRLLPEAVRLFALGKIP